MNAVVHQALPHDSAIKHVTGQAPYTDDLVEPAGTLHLQLGLSARAHAEILTLDLDPVRRAPGVFAVLCARDIPGRNDVSPFAGDDPLFADGIVHYVGQSLFAVVAETRLQARAAVDLAIVTYRDLAPITTIDQAMAAQIFIEPPNHLSRGNAGQALAQAPRRLSGRLVIGGQEHFYLEGQVALAIPGEGKSIIIHCSSQHPTEIQHVTAHVLDVPFAAVTVEVRRMGGAFGGKETQGNLPAAAAALASRLTGRAVKCRHDRDDDMMVTGKRHDFRIDYDIGFDSDGRIHGLIVHQALRCGMSYDLSQAIADRAMLHADNCYFIPHIDIHSYRCKTHTQSNTAFRGFGGPQGMLGMERMIEAVARDLGLDPLIVRQRNFYPAKDALVPDDLKRTPYGMVVSDCIIHDLVDELATSADYHARRAEIARANANSTIIKRGLSLTPVKFGISFTKTEFNQAGALIHIYTDGSVHLNHGGTEMGQGLFIKVAQVVADIFGLGLEAIQITATRTDKVPNTSATAASSGSDLNGKAAQQAATILRDRLTAFLSTRHGVASESISFADGKVQLGAEGFTFQEVIAAAYAARISLSATGFYATPKIQWDRTVKQGRPFLYFAYGAAISEVAIDTLTGESRLLRVDILHDVGKSLNPAIDRGQIEGGFVQGAGWLTFEELVHDQQGRLLTHAPSTYKIPTCGDRAIDFRLSIYERGVNEEPTIHQSKAVGEPPLMLAHSVFLAIMDAIAQTIGREPDLHAPATPERVLAALEGVS